MKRVTLCVYCLLIFVVVSCAPVSYEDTSWPPKWLKERQPVIDQDLSPYATHDSYALRDDYVLFYG